MVEIIEIDGEFVNDGKIAYREGVEACENGRPKSDNPYPQGSYSAHQWGVGWCKTNYWKGGK